MAYTLELEIAKPRSEVADIFQDETKLPCWQPGFISMEPISGEPGEVGSKIKLRYLHGKNRELEMIETITVANLPDEFTAIYDAPGMTMEVKVIFQEIDGGTRTRYVTENTPTVQGFFMKMMLKFMPGCFKRQSLIYMENFKALCETGADIRE